MEVLALLAVILMWAIGLGITRLFRSSITPEEQFYFAPAIGMGACATIAYLANGTRHNSLILIFAIVALLGLLHQVTLNKFDISLAGNARRLGRVALITFLALYCMQISLFYLFKGVYPGAHEVWDLFNFSGVSPPDQMFAWHQAMFASLHRHYPQDPFYGEMDFYDRPQLGGYLTLFFFKLFHLPLKEHQYAYPAAALRFYHSFWWLLNNLYLLGVAPLFRRLFGYRGAIMAVASTALGGFFLLCNAGGWMKFSSAYPFLLAVLLFLKGKAPVLQAILCATSYYIHGSVLPFLLGFGLLQLVSLRYPIRQHLSRFNDVAWFAGVGIVLVGAWFIVVRFSGSKQPLLYYYLYDAGLTAAQTHPVTELAKAFYTSYTWSTLSLLPLLNWSRSIFPTHLVSYCIGLVSGGGSFKLSELASVIFQSQRFVLWSAASFVTAPFVLAQLPKVLARPYSGRIILCIYLVPSLFIALIYRIQWSFSLHVICLYQTIVLFLWISYLKDKRPLFTVIALVAISLEGVVCVLFADIRFLRVHGILLGQVAGNGFLFLATYLISLAIIIIVAWLGLRFVCEQREETSRVVSRDVLIVASKKLAIGLLIVVATIGTYSIYCLRFY
ncbi:MAG TPA: hypothetical protein VLQ90_04510 [Pyrinomonadaceae bacterium]|nr:hypothetical protein [Pyrinomonadaceae bacterium]